MARKKTLNFIVAYGDTGYYINDLGVDKSPRFELYNENDDKVILKTDNPIDCNNWVKKNIWKDFFQDEFEDNVDVLEKKKRKKKS